MNKVMKRRSRDFSNFENFENYENYTGTGDDMIMFIDGQNNFAGIFDAHNTASRTFSITLTIASTFTLSGIQLFGDLFTPRENELYGGLTETITGLSVAGSPKSVKKLYSWLQNNPTVLQGFQIVSTNDSVVNGIIDCHEVSPFRDMSTEPINLSAFKNPYQFNTNMVLVQNLNRVVSNQTYWLIPCVAPAENSYQITINLYFGPAVNLSAFLEKRVERAYNGIQNIGGIAVARRYGETNVPTGGSLDQKTIPTVTLVSGGREAVGVNTGNYTNGGVLQLG